MASIPLSYYRHRNPYTMRSDARDRFGFHQEQRYPRAHIHKSYSLAGLVDMRFTQRALYGCVVLFKAAI